METTTERCLRMDTVQYMPGKALNKELSNSKQSLNNLQMDLQLRAQIMTKHGFIFTPSGKSIKCKKCGKSWGIRRYKPIMNKTMLQHAYTHESEE